MTDSACACSATNTLQNDIDEVIICCLGLAEPCVYSAAFAERADAGFAGAGCFVHFALRLS